MQGKRKPRKEGKDRAHPRCCAMLHFFRAVESELLYFERILSFVELGSGIGRVSFRMRADAPYCPSSIIEFSLALSANSVSFSQPHVRDSTMVLHRLRRGSCHIVFSYAK